MGLFSFIGSIFGGNSQKKAIDKASQQQLDYENRALAQQQAQFGVTQANLHPWIQQGTAALGGISDLTGLNGNDKQGSAITALQASPFYQSLFNNGQEAVLQNAAATGGIRGGNTQTGLADFGRDTLAQTIQQQLANLGGISTEGLGAATGLGGLSQANSNAQTGLFGNMGSTLSGATLARGGINAQMWNNAGGFLDSIANLGGLLPSTSGGGMGSIFSKIGF